MEKVTREQVVTYLDTTPSSSSEKWSLLGQGVTSYGLSYNPQITTEKFIINANATSSLDSYQIQGDVSQSIYKGDDCFEFINELRRNAYVGAKVETSALDIDLYDYTESGSVVTYKATKYDCTIAVTKYMADTAVIEYSLYYNGNPVVGTVTIADGVPTFVANA